MHAESTNSRDEQVPATAAVRSAAAPVDVGLRCPRCDYNLTGLSAARCPECGTPFDPRELRRRMRFRPIAFERARRWRKVPMFVVTWATVMFAPWVFARQIVVRVGFGHAAAFGGVCFLSTLATLFAGAEMCFIAAWLTAAVVYILLQALLLSVLDFAGWRRLLRTARFWLLVSFYTSAVMMTEFAYGPPMVLFSDLLRIYTGRAPANMFRDMFDVSLPSAVLWAQLIIWLVGLGCCFYVRQRRRWRPVGWALIYAVLACVVLFNLYAAVVQYIGIPVGEWYFEWLDFGLY